MDPNTTAVVLAAGKGTRMKAPATQNKVVMALGQKPMIRYTIDTLKRTHIGNIVVVVGYAKESVMAELGDEVMYAHQDIALGTGHAVKVALPLIPAHSNQILVMYGDDSAFYTPDLLSYLIKTHTRHANDLTFISIHKSDPFGLGRIIRNNSGHVVGVVEEKNATPEQRQITEINTGLYCFNKSFLQMSLENVVPNPITQEYYLTDTIAYACNRHYQVEAIIWDKSDIWHGVNTPEQLKAAEERMIQKNAVQ